MAAHDALYRRQAYTGAFVLFRSVQALKNAEQFVDVLHVEANAVVAHVEDGGIGFTVAILTHGADLNARGVASSGVF